MTEVDQHELYADHASGDTPSDMEMLAARQAALELVDEVLTRKQALDVALERSKALAVLPTRDKAFCRMLVATTLRRLGQIDELIAKASDKPGSTNLMLQNILRLGAAQILFMNVPDHAAVDTSVRLADAHAMDRQKAFVNGVLRNLTRVGKEWLARQDECRLNTPEWLLKIWIQDYGLKTAAEIAKAHLTEAPMDITIKDESSRNHWGSELKASQIGCGTLRRMGGGAVHEMPGFDDGQWWVQDASAAIPVHLFGDVKGQVVIDLCAAPGGKTMQLAAMGARVTALDRSAQRLKRLEENLQRLRLSEHVEIVVSDAAHWRPANGEAPKFILVDAPCSATGTIRRHPDVPHLKTPRDIEGLVSVQERILENAFDMLAPGGVLVYCVCSLQKAEGERQIERLLAARADASKIAITAEDVGGLDECVTEDGDVRILPFHQAAAGGMDGFFISRLTKAS